MAETYWPFDSIDTTETQFSQWARNIGEGVRGSSATTDLKVFGDSTGMNVKLPIGQAMVRGHYYYNTSQLTLTVSAAHATLGRIDAVVLTLDPTANTITASVVAGTPSATPVAPTLTQTDAGVYQLLLATVSVGAAVATIAPGVVTDQRIFLGNMTVSTAQTLANKTLQSAREVTTVLTTANSATPFNFDLLIQNDVFFQAGSTSNFVINFRGSGAVNLADTLAVGQTITAVLRNANSSTTTYPMSFQIDSTSVTPKWQGGAAPTAGNASSTDIYTFAITKVNATPTYAVFASQVRFA